MRDNDALIAIQLLLLATGQFASVLRGRAPQDLETTGQNLPRAWVCPAGWTEKSDADPETAVRTVRFQVGLTIDATNHAEPEEELDRLSCVAQNAIGGADFGFCMQFMTRVAEAVFPAGEPYPRLTVVLKGTFGYLVTGLGSRSTDAEF